MSEEENREKKDKRAKDVAAAMVENMQKNMEDPDFFRKKEKTLQEATNKVLKRREDRRKKLEGK